ncbi:MAG: hypothetical protein OEX13_05275 [Gammaproteobacteria bacterium]|nr:hypothetical protein [Gammaproteobacteria bacterium]MDH5309346.1 hypothetical protein [Gammaproteobacteria bacterium]
MIAAGSSIRLRGHALALGMLLCTAVGPLSHADEAMLEAGRRIYMDGILPSGEPLTAEVIRDVRVVGDQVICGKCHRKSGLGASEGQEVVPPVVGEILFNPLQLPTSKPPEPPVLRPAYTRAGLVAAIRDGIGADGEPLDVLMPRYPLSDEDMESLIGYLESLNLEPDPGVTPEEIHFATIVTDDAAPAAAQAMLAVMDAYIQQKNTETRNESQRAASGVWHKDWEFKPYRKWVLHTWELAGPRATWPDQLERLYAGLPVFAVLNGISGGSWQPIHEFCERKRLPCLFPTTDLPVDDESFYSMYFSRGVLVEAEAAAEDLHAASADAVVQLYDPGDSRSMAAADAFERAYGSTVQRVSLAEAANAGATWSGEATAAAVWLDADGLAQLAAGPGVQDSLRAVYLSGALLGGDYASVDPSLKVRARIAYSAELPDARATLLARSTGWLRVRRVIDNAWPVEQANAYFTLKSAGSSLVRIGGYFKRDYFLENFEHMMDNASYTSIYPRMSLAPGQRFVSKGAVLAVFDADDDAALTAVSEWQVPGQR